MGATPYFKVTPNFLIFKGLCLFLNSSLGGSEAGDGHAEG